MSIARKRKLLVIEDAAHAHGASDRNRPAGSLGHLASFSFQSTKNLTCGEGGLITTNDAPLAAACRSLHNCGRVPAGAWYEHEVIAGNYRLGEFQGAVLNAQLDRLQGQANTRDRNGRYLAGRLSTLPGLYPQQRPDTCTRHAYHLFMLRIVGPEFGAPRAAIVQALKAEGVPCSPGYAFSLHRQAAFRRQAFGPYLPALVDRLDYERVQCPNSDLICREQGLWLEQAMMLGLRRDMDDIYHAFEKVHEQRVALVDWHRRAGTARAGK